MAGDGFYDAGALSKIAINLFYGWGYNFYRLANQLRADDQLIRSKAASLLGNAMASVCDAESVYRREFLTAPTRAKPFPDAAAVESAQRLERLAHAIGMLEGAIQHQAVPENDRMTQRFRQEEAALEALKAQDERLVGQCELVRTMVNGQDGASILKLMPDLEAGLEAIKATLHNRAAILMGPL